MVVIVYCSVSVLNVTELYTWVKNAYFYVMFILLSIKNCFKQKKYSFPAISGSNNI